MPDPLPSSTPVQPAGELPRPSGRGAILGTPIAPGEAPAQQRGAVLLAPVPVTNPDRDETSPPFSPPRQSHPPREYGQLRIPPLRHQTVYIGDELAAEQFQQRRSEERRAAVRALETSDFFLDRSEYLRLERGRRVGSAGYNFYLHPSGDDVAANFSWKRLGETGIVLFAPGIPVSGHDGLIDYSNQLVRTYGRPVYVVPNDQHNIDGSARQPLPVVNMLRSLTNSVAGLRNADWGARREKCVLELAATLISCTEAGVPVTLVGHSQGTINAVNALLIIKQNASPAYYDKVCENVRIHSIAAAQIRLPVGTDGRVWIMDRDIVVMGGKLASSIKDRPLNPRVYDPNLEERPGSIVELRGRDHAFDAYTARYHEFFIRGVVGDVFTRESGGVLARFIVDSIGRGEFSNVIYDRMLTKVAAESQNPRHHEFYRGFREELIAARERGLLRDFTLRKDHYAFFRIDQR